MSRFHLLSKRERNFLVERERRRPFEQPTPAAMTSALSYTASFTVEHVFEPMWQSRLTFPVGKFETRSFTAVELDWMKVAIEFDGREIPLEIKSAEIRYGAFALSLAYRRELREACTRRPYGVLHLRLRTDGENAPRHITCRPLPPKRAR